MHSSERLPCVGIATALSRERFLFLLAGLFAPFNTMRIVAYLPTICAVAASGDSSQHSLWTWLTFLGGNLTMATWLWEQNGRQCHRTVVVTAANAVMCTAVVAVVEWTRW